MSYILKYNLPESWWHLQPESNWQRTLRRGLLYPFNYRGILTVLLYVSAVSRKDITIIHYSPKHFNQKSPLLRNFSLPGLLFRHRYTDPFGLPFIVHLPGKLCRRPRNFGDSPAKDTDIWKHVIGNTFLSSSYLFSKTALSLRTKRGILIIANRIRQFVTILSIIKTTGIPAIKTAFVWLSRISEYISTRQTA